MSDSHEPIDPRADEIGDRNVQRLIEDAYRPESPDPDFVCRATAAMQAAAAERRQPQALLAHTAGLGKRLLLWAVAASLLIGLGVLLGSRWRSAEENPQGQLAVGAGERLPQSEPEASPSPPPVQNAPAPASAPSGLAARPRPAAPKAESLSLGGSIETGPRAKRRLTLPDGSVVSLNQDTAVALEGPRQLVVRRGEVYVEVAPRYEGSGEPFCVKTPGREVVALGTKFVVRADGEGTGVVVTQGKVRVSGIAEEVVAGQELFAKDRPAGEAIPAIVPAPRASHLLAWTQDLVAAAESPLVPASHYGGGALVTVDPAGQESRLSLRKYHVDVHIEDGFARTTIDQTFFNHYPSRLEGTFYFPLPPDASLSRLAMYVNGKLMEGGMAERQHARQVFEEIVRRQKDPALLEWVDGSTFRMRVFPLEGRQEKRIVLSYTQRLGSLYDRTEYRFPAGHTMQEVDQWSCRVLLKGGKDRRWTSATHSFRASPQGSDLALEAEARHTKPDRDVAITLYDTLSNQGDGTARFLTAEHESQTYLALRWRPELAGPKRHPRRDWVFLFESSADRDPLLARVQVDVVRTILENAERDDTFSILAAGTRTVKLTDRPLPATPENIRQAIARLDKTHLIGALDLEQALAAAAPLVEAAKDPWLVHLGSGIPVLGQRDVDALVKRIPERARYVGVGVGRRWSRTLMKAAAARTGGYCTQINPDEQVTWRAFDLLATLNAPRLLGVRVVDKAERLRFLIENDWLAQGEELFAISRLDRGEKLPEWVEVTGLLDGKTFVRRLPVRDVASSAGYLPRTWARLEIDRLMADGIEKHRGEIVPLSKAMYVMSPLTSLLVLEDEAMYVRYSVDRGRKDHWAMYPCPEQIPVVHEPQTPKLAEAKDQKRPEGEKGKIEEVLKTVRVRITPPLLSWPVAPQGAPIQMANVWDIYNGAYAVSMPPARWGGLRGEDYYDVPDYRNIDLGTALGGGRASDQMSDILLFRSAQQKEIIASLHQIERWDVPLLDEPPVAYPDAAMWQRLTPRDRARMLDRAMGGSVRRFSESGQQLGTRVYPVADLMLPYQGSPWTWGDAGGGGFAGAGFGGMRGGLGGFGGFPGMASGGMGYGGQLPGHYFIDNFATNVPGGGFDTRFAGNVWHFVPSPTNGSSITAFTPLAFSPDGRLLLSPNGLDGVRLWEPGNGLAPVQLEANFQMPGLQLELTRLVESDFSRQQIIEGATVHQAQPLARDLAGKKDVFAKIREKVPPEFQWPPSEDGSTLLAPVFTGRTQAFTDLVAYAPAMNTSAADIAAVIEAEGPAGVRSKPERIEEAARRLIDRARAAGWQEVTLAPGGAGQARLWADAAGRYRYERRTLHGLEERAVCDGQSLIHWYPELGIGARRTVSRFHRAELAAAVPWIVPPAEELARGADVKAVDEHTIAITPSPPAPLPQAGEGKKVAVHLVFDKDGRLAERRVVEVPSGKTLLRQTCAADGTVRWLDTTGKLLAERKLGLKPCSPPELRPDLDDLVVLPLPLRAPEWVMKSRNLKPDAPDAELSKDDALALLAANLADPARTAQIIGRRFLGRGDRRLGFYALLLASGYAWNPESEIRLDQDPLRMDPLADHPGRPLARYVAACLKEQQGRRPMGPIGGDPAGFLPQLAEFHDLWQAVANGPSEGDIERTCRFVRRAGSPAWAWALWKALAGRGENLVAAAMEEIAPRLESAPGLGIPARFERARWTIRRGETAKGEELFRKLYGDAADAGLLLPLSPDFRQALAQGDGSRWTAFVHQMADRMIAAGARAGAVRLAWAVHQQGNPALAQDVFWAARTAASDKEPAWLTLTAVEYLAATGQAAQADEALRGLLADDRLAGEPGLWRVAAVLAERRGMLVRTAECLDRAAQIQHDRLGEVVNVQAVRAEYAALLQAWQRVAAAAASGRDAQPSGLIERVVRAADQWRSLDPDPSAACQAAARILADLGATDLAWNYLTTPSALQPDQPPGWHGLAQSLRSEGRFGLADRMYALAFRTEPGNAQLLWEHVQLLQEAGRAAEARGLARTLAAGHWEDKYADLVARAKRFAETNP